MATNRRDDLLKVLTKLEDESHLFTFYDIIDAVEEETPSSPTVAPFPPLFSHLTSIHRTILRLFNNQIESTNLEKGVEEIALQSIPPASSADVEEKQESDEINVDPLGSPHTPVDVGEEHDQTQSQIASPSTPSFIDEAEKNDSAFPFSGERNPLMPRKEEVVRHDSEISQRKRQSSVFAIYEEEEVRERHDSEFSRQEANDSSVSKGTKKRKQFIVHPTSFTKKKDANKYHKNCERILVEINDCMGKVIQKSRIGDLHDKNLAILLCYAFYGHRETFALWKECLAPMYSALLVVFVSEHMRSRFDYIYEGDVADIFDKQKRKFDEISKMLLEVYHTANIKKTKQLLCERYIPKADVDSNGGTLLGLANMGNAEDFFSHVSCQRMVEDRWKPGFRCNKKVFTFNFFALFGLPLLFFKSYIRFSPEKKYESGWQRFSAFHGSPCGKFAWHTTLYAIYVMVFGVFVLKANKVDNVMQVLTWLVIVLLLWQGMFFLESIIEFKLQKRGKQAFNSTLKKHLYVNHFYTVIHFSIVSLNAVLLVAALLVDIDRMITIDSTNNLVLGGNENETMQAMLSESKESSKNSLSQIARFGLLSASEVTFLVSFIFSAIRMLRVFTVDPFFGSIVITIRKMVELFAYFSVILLAFWIVYGVCQIALAGRDKNSVIWQIFINGAFEIFGELESPIKEGNASCVTTLSWENLNAQNFSWQDISGQSVQCAVRSWLVPVMLFVYTLTTSILVINILTTLINQQYEEVSDRAEKNWHSLKYRRMIEYETKLLFPPPLTPLNLIYLFGKLCKPKEGKQPAKYFYCDEDPEAEMAERRETVISLSEDEPKKAELSLREFERKYRNEFLMDHGEAIARQNNLCDQCHRNHDEGRRRRTLSNRQFV